MSAADFFDELIDFERLRVLSRDEAEVAVLQQFLAQLDRDLFGMGGQ